MRIKRTLIGLVFGRLTVIEKLKSVPTGHGKGTRTQWLCLCECGEWRTNFSPGLLTGRIVSCGCKVRKGLQERTFSTAGYVMVPAGQHHHLANRIGYAFEHRIVAEASIGRRLMPGELVHHIDENKQNNAPGNLQVLPSQHHHRVAHRRSGKRLRMPGEENNAIACECGCGALLPQFDLAGRIRRFVHGHNMDKIRSSITTEQHSERARNNQSTKTPEQRSEATRKGRAAMTREQRTTAGLRAWETRRARHATDRGTL